MCDLTVQKAFRAFITGVRKRCPPGGVVTLLCYVDIFSLLHCGFTIATVGIDGATLKTIDIS